MKISIISWVIAILGATAWVPHIVGWICKYFTKPEITIIPGKYLQVGYSILGPIFNLRLSLNVKKKDTIIDSIKVNICHQSGSKHVFEWVGMTQVFSEIKDTNGTNQIVERNTAAPIAIKLGTLSLEERFFQFNDADFLKSSPQKNEAALKKMAYLLKQRKQEYVIKEFVESQECEEYLTWVKSKLYWQPGAYTVNFFVTSPEEINQVIKTYEFTLLQNNISLLQDNLNLLKDHIKGEAPNWNWINPILKEKR